jgi:hypothetical protein
MPTTTYPNPLRSLDTGTAPRNGWVCPEAPKVDLFATLKTGTESTRCDPAQGALNPQGELFASACRFPRHLLSLHRVHAGNPPNAGLIQLNRFHVLSRSHTDCAQLSLHRGQPLAKLL